MIDISSARIEWLVQNAVGNSARYEGFQQNTTPSDLNLVADEAIITSFIHPFVKINDVYEFKNEETDNAITSLLLGDMDVIKGLCEHLYAASEIPKVKGGMFYVIKAVDILIDGVVQEALILIKEQNKHNVISASPLTLGIQVTAGIQSQKLEVGALIYFDGESYKVLAIDTVTKKGEMSFWKDDFLKISPAKDDYFRTKNLINAFHDFNSTVGRFNKIHQVKFTHKAIEFFQAHEASEIGVHLFSEVVFGEDSPNNARFIEYVSNYETAYQISFGEFIVIKDAVKAMASLLKMVIKTGLSTLTFKQTDIIGDEFNQTTGEKFLRIKYDNLE